MHERSISLLKTSTVVTILSEFDSAKVSRRCNGAFVRFSVLVVQLPKFVQCDLAPKCSITSS